jgi:hypothetical protein
MNAPPRIGIPLRPDPAAYVAEQRRSLHRAATAIALTTGRKDLNAEQFLRRAWPDDARAGVILRAATTPTSTTTSGLPAVTTVALFRSLAPASAALQLFERGMSVDLTGISAVTMPTLAALPAGAVFVAEGTPAPAIDLSFASISVGPTKKIVVLSAVSEELERSGPEAASAIIGRVLSAAVSKGLDAVAFGAAAGDAITPPGLLHGVTPIAASSAGASAMADDLGALGAAIAAAGIDASDVVYVAGAREATIIRVEASPKFDNLVLSSAAMTPKTVAAFAPAAVVSGFGDAPTIETSKQATVNFETNPLPIVDGAGVVASPTYGVFQQQLIAIKVRSYAAWTCEPGGAAVVTDVNW